ncbi:rod shape-determining protein MreD [Sporohalobacter salinus]|uniref:rod shape-determining protein MreD n=1 Tax=Sporohalobacter salinus TaxID=1494606 RepID=UPI001960CF95|nr:rod shape-determining protein MreD [Sporohalobacter salinus]MBM7623097.1 rod shape-determining protein MreD [Sporohalobacter salinus]
MRYLFYVLLILTALILQITIFAFNPVWGITPDLLLIVVISLALLNGHRQGAYIGFIAGIFQEIFSSGLFGINIIIKLTFGYIFGFFKGKVYSENILLPLSLVAVATFLNQFLIICLSDHIILKSEFLDQFKDVIAPLTGYHVLLSLVIYPAVYYIDEKYLLR